MRPYVEAWVLDYRGRPLGALEFGELQATRIANGVGEFDATLLPTADPKLLTVGQLLQVMYAPPGMALRPRGLYLIEAGKRRTDERGRTLSIGGQYISSVLRWRIFGPLGQFPYGASITYPWSQEGAYFDQYGPVDDVLKYFARYSLDEAANYGPERRSLRPHYNFVVEPNRSQGRVVAYSAKRKKLLTIAQDLAKMAANPPPTDYDPYTSTPASVTRTTGIPDAARLYYSVDQVGFGSDFSLLFHTRVGQLGVDRSALSAKPLILSVDRRTLESAEFVWDSKNQVNHLYIMAPMVQAEQDVLQPYIADITQEGAFPAGRREEFFDPGALFASGGVQLDTARTFRSVIETSYRRLRELRQVRQVSGEVALDGPLQPGVHYDFGDRIVLEHEGEFSEVHLDSEDLRATPDEVRIGYSMDYADRPRRIRHGGFTGVDAFGSIY